MHPRTKRLLNWIGSGLCLGGIVFLGLRLHNYSTQLDLGRLDQRDAYLAAALGLVFGVSNTFLARAWWNILCFKNIEVPWCLALRIYGLSQLAKYIPGNILHIAGRQSLGLAAGLPGWALAKSSVWEIGLICFCGSLFSLFALPLVWSPVTVPMVGVLCLTLSLSIVCASRLLGKYVTRAIIWHMTFLLLSGSIFLAALILVTGKSMAIALIPVWAGAYVAAWLAGVITPGAPAGLGVREAVLLLLLDGHIAAPDLMLTVLLVRIITVMGDGLFFAATMAFGRQTVVLHK